MSNFSYFYQFIGYRMIVVLFFSLLVGVMDGFGLAMFIPLLEVVSGDGANFDGEKMGNLSFLIEGINKMGIPFTLKSVLMVMLLFFVIKGVFLFSEQYLSVKYRQLFIKKLRLQNIFALADSTYEFYASLDSGKAQNTLSGEVAQVVQAFSTFVKFLNQVILLVIYLLLAFLANANFALLVLVGAVFINFLIRRIFHITKNLSQSRTTFGHQFQLLLIQFVDKFKYLKATGLTHRYAHKMEHLIHSIEENNTKSGIIGAFLAAVREPLLLAIVVVAILIQVTFFSTNMGVILLSLLLFYRALTAALISQTSWNDYLNFSGSLDNMKAFSISLQAAKEVEGGMEIDRFRSEIKLEKVNFQYGDKPVLTDISLTIPKNKVVAFIGESGSGKTTLMNLLCGLMKPTSGALTIDGQSIRDINTQSYQRRIGYITQEPVIFNDTIFHNVSFWDETTPANREKCLQAIQLAHLDRVLQDLPEGIDTLLGINGINLSGGQKQRIAIARELYKDIDILCMDEATSSLDNETEASIQENIASLKGDYTIIIIAHRLSTIKMADTVYVMSNGKVERKGRGEESS